MDCANFVLSAPMVMIICYVIGISVSTCSHRKRLDELYEENDSLSETVEELQNKLKNAKERIVSMIKNSDLD
jgi:predicted nuclease with TOPRIM domain